MKKKFIKDCEILSNKNLGCDIYEIVLRAPEICSVAKQGQFVQVKVGPSDAPLLRRPISIGDIQGDNLVLIYRVIGEGTLLLTKFLPKQIINIVGPLGNGFTLEGEKPILVGGGIGLAPLINVARNVSQKPIDVLIAARTKEEVLLWEKLFKPFCKNIYITTDDGSLGTKGNALALLPSITKNNHYDTIYSCGPDPMLCAVSNFAKEENINCQLSLEKYMACGIGACMSCSCSDTKGKRKRVCLNGPIFYAGEVEGL